MEHFKFCLQDIQALYEMPDFTTGKSGYNYLDSISYLPKNFAIHGFSGHVIFFSSVTIHSCVNIQSKILS